MIKNENYIVIQGWMVNELNLKGNELLVYAIIYGFSQAENQLFNASLQYLADWVNGSKQGIINNLKSLIEKGLIIKNDKVINNVKFVEYYTTELNGGIQKSLMGGIQKSLTNNIDINNINNNKRKKETKYNSIINELIEDDNLKDLIYEFIKMRALKKKPLTDRALKMQINKLQKLSSDIEIQKKIVEKTIVKCWDEFYELKEENSPYKTAYEKRQEMYRRLEEEYDNQGN